MKTTIELPEPLVERAKRLAARDSTTLRELIEIGLRRVLEERESCPEPFRLRDARVDGRGLSEEFVGAAWSDLRGAAYEGRGG